MNEAQRKVVYHSEKDVALGSMEAVEEESGILLLVLRSEDMQSLASQ